MCVVSNVGDYGRQMWPKPWVFPSDPPPFAPKPMWPEIFPTPKPYTGPTREQFEEFLELLRAARKFDKAPGQAECPAEEKTGWVKDAAKYFGIDEAKIAEIFK
jgi:hypothetical protein